LQPSLSFLFVLRELRPIQQSAFDFLGDGATDGLAVIRRQPELIEPPCHLIPEPLAVAAINAGAAEKGDVSLPWLAVNADALDQNGFKPRSPVVALGLRNVSRLRLV
jgi:hypothetical protein